METQARPTSPDGEPTEGVPPDPDQLVAVDALVIGLISASICLFSQRWLMMTALVPGLLGLRMLVVSLLIRRQGGSLATEWIFFLICTGLGAFNDWNSVCHHRIYDYSVPHRFAFSSIPLWMLLYWGLILRFIARLARWRALVPPARLSNRVGFGRFSVDRPLVRVAAALGLVLITRQAIYRLYLDPIWSWLPFLAALVVYLAAFHPTRHDLKLLAVFLLGGPAIEILYIQLGDLHRYHLGWIGGVPVWIAIWWLVVVLIWKDLAFRMENWLKARF